MHCRQGTAWHFRQEPPRALFGGPDPIGCPQHVVRVDCRLQPAHRLGERWCLARRHQRGAELPHAVVVAETAAGLEDGAARHVLEPLEGLEGAARREAGGGDRQVHVEHAALPVELRHPARQVGPAWQPHGTVLRLHYSYDRGPRARDRRPRHERLEGLREDVVVQREVPQVRDGKGQGIARLARAPAAPAAAGAPHKPPQGSLLCADIFACPLEDERRSGRLLEVDTEHAERYLLEGRPERAARRVLPDRPGELQLLVVHEPARGGAQSGRKPGDPAHPRGAAVPVGEDDALVLDQLRERAHPDDGRGHDAEAALTAQDEARKRDIH
mmetsp:Transcript_109716/g.310372  ORF Transcript_109716/g.310372 Transcript_109716/m.310372 type:complete len:328 (+) Transcript_109716:71-1054(+)